MQRLPGCSTGPTAFMRPCILLSTKNGRKTEQSLSFTHATLKEQCWHGELRRQLRRRNWKAQTHRQSFISLILSASRREFAPSKVCLRLQRIYLRTTEF